MGTEERPLVSRRTVAKGIAWTVPVMAVGVATPAYAMSPGCFQSAVLEAAGVEDAGNGARRYSLTLQVNVRGTSGCQVPVAITSMWFWYEGFLANWPINSDSPSYDPPPATITETTTFTLSARVHRRFPFLADLWPNRVTVNYTIDGTAYSETITVSAAGLRSADERQLTREQEEAVLRGEDKAPLEPMAEPSVADEVVEPTVVDEFAVAESADAGATSVGENN